MIDTLDIVAHAVSDGSRFPCAGSAESGRVVGYGDTAHMCRSVSEMRYLRSWRVCFSNGLPDRGFEAEGGYLEEYRYSLAASLHHSQLGISAMQDGQ